MKRHSEQNFTMILSWGFEVVDPIIIIIIIIYSHQNVQIISISSSISCDDSKEQLLVFVCGIFQLTSAETVELI